LFEGGSVFISKNGIYLQCDKVQGQQALPVVFASYGNGRAILEGDSSTVFMIWAPASGVSALGFVFKNLELRGNGTAKAKSAEAHGISVWNSSASANMNYLLIEDCEIHHFLGNGINIGRDLTASRINNVIIRNVTSHDNFGAAGHSPHSGSGIILGGSNNSIVEHCIAYNNGKNNNNYGGPVGIWMWDCTNCTIQYCESYNNETTKGDGGGFDIDGGCSNCIIQYCYSHHNAGAGYLFAQFAGANQYGLLQNNILRYNISQNDGRKGSFAGIYFWGNGSNDYVGKNLIYNNTIYMGGTAENGSPACVGFLGSSCKGVKIYNNIFIAADGKSLINGNYFDTSQVFFKGNNFWCMPGTNFKIYWRSKNYISLDSWSTGTMQETDNGSHTGYFVNPKLKNPGFGATINNTYLLDTLTAYNLLASSALINKGINLNAMNINQGNNDFYKTPLPQGILPDVGAHEFPELQLNKNRLFIAIYDNNKNLVDSASVSFNNIVYYSNKTEYLYFEGLQPAVYNYEISKKGFQSINNSIEIINDTLLNINLSPATSTPYQPECITAPYLARVSASKFIIKNAEKSNIHLFDMKGNLLLKSYIASNNHELNITYEKGIYFVKISNLLNQKCISEKIIIY
jgi:hypothetical protein